jgi:BASS family bile acid:Na+ symporter
MQTARKLCLYLAAAAAALLVAGLLTQNSSVWQPAAVAASVGLAIGVGAIPSLRTYQFTAWIFAGFVGAMIYPANFLSIGGFDLRNKWLIVTMMQIVMFGMGTQMSLRDLAGVMRMPHAVVIGVGLQFTVMPLVGYTLANLFDFPPEVAAGIVLVGSCSSGLASNVMTYIAKANLPLSITLTAVATLLAPLMTPLWMKLLASEMVPVDFVNMMLEIIKLVIVPIGAAMLADYLVHASSAGRRTAFALAGAAACVLIGMAFGGGSYLAVRLSGNAQSAAVVFGYLLGALVVGVAYFGLRLRLPVVEKFMPLFAMFGIVFVTSVTAAAGRDRLLAIGAMLFVAVVIHNTAGYVLGYWLSRAAGLDKNSARTVAIEVGLQNGGMATSIAAAKGQLATLGLAAAVFNPWMNVSGSLLANYWRRRPLDSDLTPPADESNSGQGDAD